MTASEGVHKSIQEIYTHPVRVGSSILLHLAAWLLGTAEAWIALELMGHPLPVTSVIALEAMVFAVRTVAFFIPSAAGVQEGGYVAIGALLGLPGEIALALSLLKRAREVITSIPPVLAWQMNESRRLLAARTRN